MNGTDLYISKGTCFFGPGQVADSKYLPCGNSELLGPQSCCYAGDFCLSSTACFDTNSTSFSLPSNEVNHHHIETNGTNLGTNTVAVVTYLAGCTDSTFTSAKCTNKYEYPDQQYVAIARCEGDDVDIWSGCSRHPKWVEIQKEPDCACNASKPLIRNPNGKSSLYEIAHLPTTGSTISFNPTAVPTLTSTDNRNSDSTTETSPPTASPAPTPDAPQDQPSNTHIIIGVTVGVGIPLLAALIFIVLFLRRRKLAAKAAASAINTEPQEDKALHEGQQPIAEQEIHDEQSTIDPAVTSSPKPPQPASPWYGYKSELEATSAPKPELAGDEPRTFTTSSWNSGTLDSHQVSELSNHDAVTSATK
ncbi:hypothetical protein F4814DRAFT_450290 [Daldinia grandis]|nr:hypothetical protein F4814DRAFT_450290 [Daldinia grandis]